MKNKFVLISVVFFVSLIIFSSFPNTLVRAQEEHPYTLGIKKYDEFVWEVTDLDLYYFERVFGSEPNFDIGDKNRAIITDLYESEIEWAIYTEEWYYKDNWGENGVSVQYELLKNPVLFTDNIYILMPVDDYLEEAATVLPSEYTVRGSTVTKIVKSDATGVEYRWEKQFDIKGFLHRESVYLYDPDPDAAEILIVRIEGGFRVIPMGITFLIFTFIALFALIIISMKGRKFHLTNK